MASLAILDARTQESILQLLELTNAPTCDGSVRLEGAQHQNLSYLSVPPRPSDV